MTNAWIERSVRLAEGQDYLLKVSQIYPATIPPRRPLDRRTREMIETLHKNRDGKRLLRLLLDLRRKGHPFPIEHPYVPLLGKHDADTHHGSCRLSQGFSDPFTAKMVPMASSMPGTGLALSMPSKRTLGTLSLAPRFTRYF